MGDDRLDGGVRRPQTPIITGIPKGTIHNGGRLKFGPDGFLYVMTGETGRTGLSQDLRDLGGKILRVTTSATGAREPVPRLQVLSSDTPGAGTSRDRLGRGRPDVGQRRGRTWDEARTSSRPVRTTGGPPSRGSPARRVHRPWYASGRRAMPRPVASASGPTGRCYALRGESLEDPCQPRRRHPERNGCSSASTAEQETCSGPGRHVWMSRTTPPGPVLTRRSRR